MSLKRRSVVVFAGSFACYATSAFAQVGRPNSSERLGYSPPADTVELLGDILPRSMQGRSIRRSFSNKPNIFVQARSGELYFETPYELPSSRQSNSDPLSGGQAGRPTALRFRNGDFMNPDRVPFVILPAPAEWLLEYNIQLGDYAAVVLGKKIAFAVFGEYGPVNRLGAGSAVLLRALGIREQSTGRLSVNITEPSITTIVFPNTGSVLERRNESRLLGAILERGPELFQAAGGRLSMGDIVAPLRDEFRSPGILWIDDHPENNRLEVNALRRIGFRITQIQSSGEAIQKLAAGLSWDLVVSDIDRNNQADAGLIFGDLMRRAGHTMPLIFMQVKRAGSDSPLEQIAWGLRLLSHQMN